MLTPTVPRPITRFRAGSIHAQRKVADALTRTLFGACALVVVAATCLILAFLARAGVRGFLVAGSDLLVGTVWQPERHRYGGVPLIAGTVATAVGAMLLGGAPAVLSAIWVHELSPRALRVPYRRVMELAVALPSVVYGWLALTYFVPALEAFARACGVVRATGEGLAAASLLLGLMIAPTVHLLTVDALARVSEDLRLASLALGASRVQTAFRVATSGAGKGIVVALFFGFARAAGETMAVQMVIGGARTLPRGLFSPTSTIATQIVMEMQNVRPDTPESDVLYSMSIVLLLISTGVVLITRFIGASPSPRKHA